MRWLVFLALRNVFRNKRRSALTTLTVLLGTALLTLGLSWLNGIMGMILGGATDMAGEVRVVTPEYSLREASFPLYEKKQSLGYHAARETKSCNENHEARDFVQETLLVGKALLQPALDKFKAADRRPENDEAVMRGV